MEKPDEKDNGEEIKREAGDGEETDESSSPEALLQAAVKAKENAQKELLYARAEYDNYRKRMIREQEQAIKFANEKLISDLTTIADSLDRALEHAGALKKRTDDKEATDFITGIELTNRELTALFARVGAELVGARGESFDPNRHEAVSQVPATKDSPSGSVVEVVQKGCLLQGRLIKPARVVVAQ